MGKKLASWVHLWLGLTSGLVVFISLTAAAIFVWEQELTGWLHPDAVYVSAVKPNRLPFHILLHSAQNAVKPATLSRVEIENDPAKAYAFYAYKDCAQPGWSYSSGIDYSYTIYVDPYTGLVTGLIDTKTDWLTNLYPLHVCLLLNYEVGHYVVGGATLILFLLVLSGIILWWPKNKAALKQRVWLQWKPTTKWRRKNYDLHNIGGIYSFLPILLLAVTGLVWTFDWWENGIYRLLGNDPTKVFKEPPPPKPIAVKQMNPYDLILSDGMRRVKHWDQINLQLPESNSDRAFAIACYIKYRSGRSGWDETDDYFYHSKTGRLYFQDRHGDKTVGAKWRYSNYAIHTGSIYGLPSKLVASVSTLFCAFLPVTGFLIWWGRRNKKK